MDKAAQPTPSAFRASIENHCRKILIGLCCIFAVSGCQTPYNPLEEFEPRQPSTLLEAPPPRQFEAGAYDSEQVAKGKYLVELLGCGSCHTDGALVGEPNSARLLAGSGIGIAYSNPLQQEYPGVVYPPNLTPDPETGLGAWSEQQVVEMIRTGVDRHGRNRLPVMPWPAYNKLQEQDAEAIAAYLLNLPPVIHQVPDKVPPGNKASEPYVHFGVYYKN